MKITFISEDHPDGFQTEWPLAPGFGDFVSFRYPGGTVKLKVASVEYEADADYNLTGVVVRLTY